MSTDQRRRLGAEGEALAAAWYLANGYQPVATNWRCRDGEIDLIVRRARLFVFCEVKTRSSAAFGSPVEAVTRTKQMRLRRLAARWLQDECPVHPSALRFDVVSILAGQVEVIEGAF
ncbi:MAG: YraN family protein [Acidimicrobiales bacterium]